MNRPALLILTLSSLLLWGCDVTWSEDSAYDYAIFSETGESVAMVFQTYEKKNKMKYIAKRNFKTQVVVQNDDGSKTVLSELAEGNVQDFFYQQEAGYIILGRVGETTEGPDGSDYGWTAYDRISLDGTLTPLGSASGTLMLSCDGGSSKSSVQPPVRWIPSPDGSILARIDAEVTCATRELTLRFVDAQSLEVMSGPYTLNDATPSSFEEGQVFWPTLSLAWMEDGAFAIGDWASSGLMDHLSAQLYTPGSVNVTEKTLHFNCFAPSTQSHYTTMDLMTVVVDDQGVVHTHEDLEYGTGFGCGGN